MNVRVLLHNGKAPEKESIGGRRSVEGSSGVQ